MQNRSLQCSFKASSEKVASGATKDSTRSLGRRSTIWRRHPSEVLPDPSGMCIRPDGSIDFWGLPPGPWWPCWFNTTSGPSVTPAPAITPIINAYTICSTPPPTSTSTPTPILPPTLTLTPTDMLVIPQKIDNFFDIKDDPVELIARAVLGEEAQKLFTSKEDDAVGVAWAIRNRYESGVYYSANRDASRTAHGEYNWYWSANSQIYGMTTLRAHDPLNSGYWKTREGAIRAYNRAREIAKQVLNADKSQDITHGAIRWADQGLRQGEKEMKWGDPVRTAYGFNPVCINCIQYSRTHFDNDYVSDPNPYNPYRTSWCVTTVPLSECQE